MPAISLRAETSLGPFAHSCGGRIVGPGEWCCSECGVAATTVPDVSFGPQVRKRDRIRPALTGHAPLCFSRTSVRRRSSIRVGTGSNSTSGCRPTRFDKPRGKSIVEAIRVGGILRLTAAHCTEHEEFWKGAMVPLPSSGESPEPDLG